MTFLQFVKEYVQEHPSLTFKQAMQSEDVKKLFHKKGDKKPEKKKEKKEEKKDDANIVINVNNNCGSDSSGSSGSKGGKKESSGRKPGRPRGSKTIKPGSGSANLPYAGQQPPRPPGFGGPFDPPAPPPPDVPVKKEIKEEKKKDKKKKILDDLSAIEQDIEEIKDDDDESHIEDEDDYARRKDASYSRQIPTASPVAKPVKEQLKKRLFETPSAPPLEKLDDDLGLIDSEVFDMEQIYDPPGEFYGENQIIVPQNLDSAPQDDLVQFMYGPYSTATGQRGYIPDGDSKGKGLEVGSDDEVDGEGIKKKKKTAKQIIKEYTKKQPTPGPRKYEIPRPELLRQGSLRDKEALLKVIEAMRLMLI